MLRAFSTQIDPQDRFDRFAGRSSPLHKNFGPAIAVFTLGHGFVIDRLAVAHRLDQHLGPPGMPSWISSCATALARACDLSKITSRMLFPPAYWRYGWRHARSRGPRHRSARPPCIGPRAVRIWLRAATDKRGAVSGEIDHGGRRHPAIHGGDAAGRDRWKPRPYW